MSLQEIAQKAKKMADKCSRYGDRFEKAKRFLYFYLYRAIDRYSSGKIDKQEFLRRLMQQHKKRVDILKEETDGSLGDYIPNLSLNKNCLSEDHFFGLYLRAILFVGKKEDEKVLTDFFKWSMDFSKYYGDRLGFNNPKTIRAKGLYNVEFMMDLLKHIRHEFPNHPVYDEFEKTFFESIPAYIKSETYLAMNKEDKNEFKEVYLNKLVNKLPSKVIQSIEKAFLDVGNISFNYKNTPNYTDGICWYDAIRSIRHQSTNKKPVFSKELKVLADSNKGFDASNSAHLKLLYENDFSPSFVSNVYELPDLMKKYGPLMIGMFSEDVLSFSKVFYKVDNYVVRKGENHAVALTGIRLYNPQNKSGFVEYLDNQDDVFFCGVWRKPFDEFQRVMDVSRALHKETNGSKNKLSNKVPLVFADKLFSVK